MELKFGQMELNMKAIISKVIIFIFIYFIFIIINIIIFLFLLKEKKKKKFIKIIKFKNK